MINASIFRAYDIRGIVGTTLTREGVYAIGRALGSLVLEKKEKSIAIGQDGRESGGLLSAALREGLLSTGCDVIDIGVVPTPPALLCHLYISHTLQGNACLGAHPRVCAVSSDN